MDILDVLISQADFNYLPSFVRIKVKRAIKQRLVGKRVITVARMLIDAKKQALHDLFINEMRIAHARVNKAEKAFSGGNRNIKNHPQLHLFSDPGSGNIRS